MDVDTVQKISKLAKELLQHNMAPSMDEAVKLAENMLKTNKDITEVKERMKPVEQSEINKDALLRKLINMVNQHEKEIGNIKKRLDELINKVENIHFSDIKEKEKQVLLKKDKNTEKKEKAHPKSGSYSSDDVSVEKMFYFGNKPK